MPILAALILALIVSLLFAPGYRTGSFAPLIVIFLILFMVGVASQYWIVPYGPTWWGISWGPLLFVLLISSFLFIAPSPYDARTTKEAREAEPVVAAVSIFVWLLFVLLITAIIIGVLRAP